jgi:DNA repair protein RecO (recombination protein O)
MAAPHVYQTQAIVVKQSKIGEADRIVTIYTPGFGKLQAIAKGACRPGSKLGGNVELLTYSSMMLAKGRNLDIITQSQTIDAFAALRNDLWHMACALYALELVDSSTLENSENSPLFDLLLNTLRCLCQLQNDESVVRYFELHLLQHLGYRPQLRRCVDCDSRLNPVINFFSYRQGGILCPRCNQKEPTCRPLSVDALKVLRLWQGCDYATASRVKIGRELSSELEQVMQGYMRCLLQREFKSMAWLQELKKKSLVDNCHRTN